MKLERGSTAVVTGGGSGIGRGMALAFARRGLNVVLADIDAAAGRGVAAEIGELGGAAVAVRTDVTDSSSVEALATASYERFGSVELLCNNAGVLLFRSMVKATIEDWQWVLSVNLWGVVNGLQAFLPRMLAQSNPRHIVNTASISGLVTHEALPVGLYNTSKFAVVGLSEALAGELRGSGIGVSILCPGDVRTRITDAGRNRPEALGGPVHASPKVAAAMDQAMDPGAVAEIVVAAVEADELYVHTHASNRKPVEQRHHRIEAAFDDLDSRFR
jgi:NAD(P)-dependent dehydrogenase (short-subunit alcohol dehydrogenase family)